MVSKRKKRQKECGDKIHHATEAAASVHRNKLPKGDVPLAVYRCHWCGYWHIGRKSFQAVRAMKAKRGY